MQGNSPMQAGQGPGLSLRDLGETGGEQTVTLLDSEMPSHTHDLQASPLPADLDTPGPQNALARSSPGIYKVPPGAMVQMSPNTVGPAGGSQPHNNMMPYLTLNFCIALQGVYPPRS
jgi:microcystin-dependent protein